MITINSNSFYAILLGSFYASIEMRDMYFEQTDALNNLIIDYQFIGGIIMDNITINNNDILNTDPIGFFHFIPFDNGVLQATNITIMNSNIGVKPIIDLKVAGTLIMTIENVFVQNVTMGTNTKMFEAQSLRSLYFKNSTFIQVQPQVSGDTTPKIIGLTSIALTDQGSYTILDTHLEQSTIGFLELSGISNNEDLTNNFAISNFSYANSYLDLPQDLISFTAIETNNNFQIELTNIEMRNITFVRTGRLIVLEHQTSTTLKISN